MNNLIRWLIIISGTIICGSHLNLYSQVREDMANYDPQLNSSMVFTLILKPVK